MMTDMAHTRPKAGPARSVTGRAVVARCAEGTRKAIREPENNEIDAAYTLIRASLRANDPGGTK